MIAVETVVRNPKNLPLVYGYTVSGGRVIGKGEKVVWDLKGVRPGIYTIDVAIDYGRGFVDNPKSKTVTIIEPACDPPCLCPAVDVVGGGEVQAGENLEFTAVTAGGAQDEIIYKWTVSQGEIVEGQGKSKIIVKTTSETIGEVKATVEIGGSDFCSNCEPTAFETGTVVK
ncbi:MAG TPA: hypothetical protein VIL74_18700 [Pyrinomonadaceae bacterium]